MAKYGYSQYLACFESGETFSVCIGGDDHYTIKYNKLSNVCKIKRIESGSVVSCQEFQDPNCVIDILRDAINEYHAVLNALGILPHPIAEAICEYYEGNHQEIFDILTFYAFATWTEREMYYTRHGIKIKSLSAYC